MLLKNVVPFSMVDNPEQRAESLALRFERLQCVMLRRGGCTRRGDRGNSRPQRRTGRCAILGSEGTNVAYQEEEVGGRSNSPNK